MRRHGVGYTDATLRTADRNRGWRLCLLAIGAHHDTLSLGKDSKFVEAHVHLLAQGIKVALHLSGSLSLVRRVCYQGLLIIHNFLASDVHIKPDLHAVVNLYLCPRSQCNVDSRHASAYWLPGPARAWWFVPRWYLLQPLQVTLDRSWRCLPEVRQEVDQT
eukprot:scaffold1194_cov369-Prasinococcus_capsulatus_cf.AAC.22